MQQVKSLKCLVFVLVSLIAFNVFLPLAFAEEPRFNYNLQALNVITDMLDKRIIKVSAVIKLDVNGGTLDSTQTDVWMHWWKDGYLHSNYFKKSIFPGVITTEEISFPVDGKGTLDITCALNANENQSVKINGTTVKNEFTYSDNKKTLRIEYDVDNGAVKASYISSPKLSGHGGANAHEKWQEVIPTEGPKYGEEAKEIADSAQEANEIQDRYRGQSPFERMIAGVFTALSQSIYEMLGLKDPLELIFDYDPMVEIREHPKRSELYLGIFGEEDSLLISQIFVSLMKYTPLLLVIMLAAVGLYLMFVSSTGDARHHAKDVLQAVIICMVALAVGPYLIDMCFDLIYSGVEIVKSLIEFKLAERGMSTPKSLVGVMLGGLMMQTTDALGPDEIVSAVRGVSALGYAIVIFAVFLSSGILNWQYFLRKLTIAVLILIFPAVAIASVIPQKRRALEVWISEFLSQATLVLAHAVSYGFLIMMFLTYNRPFGVFEVLVYTLGLNTVTNYVRQIFGVGGSPLGTVTGTAGLGSILFMSRIIRGKGSFSTQQSSTPDLTSTARSAGSSAASRGFAGGTANVSEGMMNYTANQFSQSGQKEGSSSSATYTPFSESTFTTSSQYEPSNEDYSSFAPLQGTNGYDKDVNYTDEPYVGQPSGSRMGYNTNETTEEGHAQQTSKAEPQKQKASQKNKWSGAVRTAGMATGVIAGGLLSGAVLGNIAPGMIAGGKIGANTSKQINNGIFTLGEKLDLKTASSINKSYNQNYESRYNSYTGNISNAKYSKKSSQEPEHNIFNSSSNRHTSNNTKQAFQELTRQYHSQGNIKGYEWRP